MNAFWRFDAFSGSVVTTPTLDNFAQIVGDPVFRDVAVRTILTAAAVTITDVAIAFPVAYFMARLASRRTRNILLWWRSSCRSGRATWSRSTPGA